jgi:hypothetical protein
VGGDIVNQTFTSNASVLNADEWALAYQAAKELDQYTRNWDGEGASPVPREYIQATLAFFERLEGQGYTPPDYLYPAADGTLMMEWHHTSGTRDLISIDSRGFHLIAMDSAGNILTLPAGKSSIGFVGLKERADEDSPEYSLAA